MPESTATTFSPVNYFSEASSKRLATEFTVDLEDMKNVVPHPEPIKISYGDPNYEFFPIHSLDVAVKSKPFDVEPPSNYLTERVMQDEKSLELKKALNYYWTGGHKSLLGFITEFISEVHPPAYKDWEILITNGAANGLNKAIETVVSTGDTVLVEEFSYTPFFAHVKDVGGTTVGVKLNLQKDGVDYDYLENLLDNWETTHPNKKKPKCFYTIPTGQNPTGLTQSLELRKKIYALAEKHDFLIIEDDPYGYISLPPYKDMKAGLITSENITKEEYLKTLIPSYLSLDTKGRVMRIETFSKVFAPGLRLGFMVAHKEFMKPLSVFSSVATGAPSGTSQTLVNNTIQHLGGVNGWIQWLIELRKAYISRRNLMLDTLFSSVASKNNLISVIDPGAGMFVTVIVNFGADKVSQYNELMAQLTLKTMINGVQVVVGPKMQTDKESLGDDRCNIVRLTIAAVADDDELVEAVNRFTTSVVQLFEDLKN